MNNIPIVFLALVGLSFIMLNPQPSTYAIGESESTSAIESRQKFFDQYCIGIFPKGPIGTEDIENEAVTNSKLADNAVTNEKIADGAITGNKVHGVEKLMFTGCGTFEDITLDPDERHTGTCNIPGVEAGDRVVSTLNPIIPRQGSFCFGVIDSEARSTDGVGGEIRVISTFKNECDYTTTELYYLLDYL